MTSKTFFFFGKTVISLKLIITKSRVYYTQALAKSWYKIQGGGLECKTREFGLWIPSLAKGPRSDSPRGGCGQYELPQNVRGVTYN